MASNEYEVAARLKKCQKLTNSFVAGGFTTEHVRRMTEDDWTKLAKDLQLAKKPSQPTRDMVILNLSKWRRSENISQPDQGERTESGRPVLD